MAQPNSGLKPSLKPQWGTVAKVGAITTALGGVLLHLMGQVVHRVYLAHLGVNAGHFPKTADWFVINGYYTLAELFLVLAKAFFAHAWLIALSILVLCIYMYGLEGLGRWLRSKEPKERVAGLPIWVSDLIRNLLASTLVLVGVPVALGFVMLILLMPAVVGETLGVDIAERDLERFTLGCGHGASKATSRCSQVAMDDKVLITGYVIDASESHVAIFDPAAQRTTVLETAGKMITGLTTAPPNE